MKGVKEIVSNGSKWAGQKPDSIGILLDRLMKYEMEDWSLTGTNPKEGTRKYFGNFKEISGVFNIYVELDSEADNALMRAFRRNRRMF